MMRSIDWYFPFVSPFAYPRSRRFARQVDRVSDVPIATAREEKAN